MSNRTHQIHFLISERKHERLLVRVRKSGLSISAYMRHLIESRVPRDRPPPGYFEVQKELRAIGRNINQIALVANATGIIDAKKYDEKYGELRRLTLDLISVSEMPEDDD